MSWFSTNYEKALLGGGVAIALGMAYVGWSQLNSVDEDFGIALKGQGNNIAAVEGADRIPKAIQSMNLSHDLKQGMDGSRPVDLFTGVALFIKRSNPEQAIDLLEGPDVHPGIPNSFWLDNRLDPGFADAPGRDPDSDGFSNMEEYLAKTDPNDSKSHPELITKLRYVGDESLAWVLKPGYGAKLDADKPELKFPMTYEDGKRRKNKASAASMIAPGELFFSDEPAKERFKLLGHIVRKELNQAINLEMEVTYVRVEDQKPNKVGTVYEIPSPLGRGQVDKHTQYDRSAILSLEALGMMGQEFTVEENTRFSLPKGGPNKDYLLKEVSPQMIVIEYPTADGNRKTVTVARGATPQL